MSTEQPEVAASMGELPVMSSMPMSSEAMTAAMASPLMANPAALQGYANLGALPFTTGLPFAARACEDERTSPVGDGNPQSFLTLHLSVSVNCFIIACVLPYFFNFFAF